MLAQSNSNSPVNTTSHRVVLPFYGYAALSFLACCILLFFSAEAFTKHYFHPHTLAITHIMALGWGTMIILGASHQLIPVLIEKSLYSTKLAYASFILAAVGIPLLVYGFYAFEMGWPAKWGGRFVLLSVLCYAINLVASICNTNTNSVHALFVVTASFWLFITAFLGLALVYNFTYTFLPKDTLHYLPVHAHAGVIGWFLLLVIGVGSKLIPMFLISKYGNTRLLWAVYILINGGLLLFFLLFLYLPSTTYFFIPVIAVLLAILLFAYYCYNCFKQRIRQLVDEQMKFSLLSVLMMLIPMVFLASILGWLLSNKGGERMTLIYGFTIFFGWITALIFGMTFKTLPFIVWNKVYHKRVGLEKTPSPKDLFSNQAFIVMCLLYLSGFVLFISGIYMSETFVLNFAAVILIAAAFLYNFNVFKVLMHKPNAHGGDQQ